MTAELVEMPSLCATSGRTVGEWGGKKTDEFPQERGRVLWHETSLRQQQARLSLASAGWVGTRAWEGRTGGRERATLQDGGETRVQFSQPARALRGTAQQLNWRRAAALVAWEKWPPLVICLSWCCPMRVRTNQLGSVCWPCFERERVLRD